MLLDQKVASQNGFGYSRSRRMLSTAESLSSRFQLLLDICVAEALLFTLVWFKGTANLSIYYNLALISAGLIWLVYSNAGVYRRFSGQMGRAIKIFWTWSKVFAALIVIGFVTKVSQDYSRQVIITWFLTGWAVQYITHTLVNYWIRVWLAKRRQTVASVMVGNSQLGKYLADHINSNPWVAPLLSG